MWEPKLALWSGPKQTLPPPLSRQPHPVPPCDPETLGPLLEVIECPQETFLSDTASRRNPVLFPTALSTMTLTRTPDLASTPASWPSPSGHVRGCSLTPASVEAVPSALNALPSLPT